MAKAEQNVPKLRFPGFSGEWEQLKIDELGTVIRGASPRPKGDKRYYGGTIPRLMVEDVTRDGKYVTPKTDFLTDAGAKLSRPCSSGTLTIVCSGTVGVPSILAVDACIHDGFLAVINLKKITTTEFLFTYLSRLQERFNASATHGGVFVNLTTQILKEFTVSLPTLPEQKKIAGFLGVVDRKIAQLEKKKALLERYKKGAMQALFSQKLRFKDDNGEPFPDWEEKRLSRLLSEPKERNRNLHFGKTDVLSVSGESGCVNQIEFLGRSYAGVSVKDYHVVRQGDIVYTKSPLKANPYGIIKANKGRDGIVSTLYAVYRPTDESVAEYLDYYFQIDDNLNSYLRPIVRKGAKNDMKVNNSDVLKDKIFIPHPAEQQKIADFLTALDRKIDLIALELTHARNFKNGLLQQMFV